MRGNARGTFGFVALLLTAPAWAEARLTGVVSLNREHGTPVAGVAISAVGANHTVSGDDGVFILSFPAGHPGQDVKVIVNRPGWDVVNGILLDQRLPHSPDVRPLEIIICLGAEREQRVAEFYRLKGNHAVEQTYRIKLAELEGRHAATVQERDRLVRERDDARKQVEEWARQAAARKPDEVRGASRNALRMFVEGKTDSALELLSDDRLEQETEEAKAQLDQAMQGWLLKGQLLTSKFDYKGASRNYDKALASAPGSAEAWFAYAYLHQLQNHFAQARRGYEQALALERVASRGARLAAALNNLAALSHAENRNDDAHRQFEEALKLSRALATTNPEVYLPNVARTLNNLGVLSAAENRNDDARKQFDEALKLYRALAKTNPEVYPRDVIRTLSNWGNLSSAESRNDDARKQFEEALKLYRALAKANHDDLQIVAMTLNNLGNLSSAENRNTEARKQYEEALGLYRALAKVTPNVYLPNVATTLNNLGILSSVERRNGDAHEQFEEALSLYRGLATTNPEVYRPDVATTLDNLRLLTRAEGAPCVVCRHGVRLRARGSYQPRMQVLAVLILSLPR